MTGWYIWFSIAFAIILSIVIAVAVVTQLSRRIGRQADTVANVLSACRENTTSIARVHGINVDTQGITSGLESVRRTLS
jgi:hypothetical protein